MEEESGRLELRWPTKNLAYVSGTISSGLSLTNNGKFLPYDHFIVNEKRLLVDKKEFGDVDPLDKKEQNLLIKGDNLLALKALEPDFTNSINLIYVDLPFNTGDMFEQYKDGVPHSIWLSIMRSRFLVLRELLNEDGTICVHIDNNEIGYLIPLLDEIFYRKNFVQIISWKQSSEQDLRE